MTTKKAQAPTSAEHKGKFGNDAIPETVAAEDGAGMPPGYKPDTSVMYKKGDDKPENTNMGGNVLPVLKAGHTYRDRVEAQATSLGMVIDPTWTMERLLLEIRLQGSA